LLARAAIGSGPAVILAWIKFAIEVLVDRNFGHDSKHAAARPRGYAHEPALCGFAIMMMLSWRHRLFEIATSFRDGSWS
jgi:hypothetical protein